LASPIRRPRFANDVACSIGQSLAQLSYIEDIYPIF
jgi:hypothetical protein